MPVAAGGTSNLKSNAATRASSAAARNVGPQNRSTPGGAGPRATSSSSSSRQQGSQGSPGGGGQGAAPGSSTTKTTSAVDKLSGGPSHRTSLASAVRTTLDKIKSRSVPTLGTPQNRTPQKSGLHEASLAEYQNAVRMGHETAGTTAEKIDKVYQALGFDKIQRAAMLGRNAVETGHFDPNVLSGLRRGDEGTAVGLGQWRGDRIIGVNNFAKSIGESVKDPVTQAAALVNELKTRETSAYRDLRNANNVAEAMAAMNKFERPRGYRVGGDPEKVAGYRDAMKYAEKYSPTPVGGMVVADGRYPTDPQEIRTLVEGKMQDRVPGMEGLRSDVAGLDQTVFKNMPGTIGPVGYPTAYNEAPRDDRMPSQAQPTSVAGGLGLLGGLKKAAEVGKTYAVEGWDAYTEANKKINDVPGGAATVTLLTKLFGGMGGLGTGAGSLGSGGQGPFSQRDPRAALATTTEPSVPFWLSQMLNMETV